MRFSKKLRIYPRNGAHPPDTWHGTYRQAVVHEAGLQERTILVEFDSYDIARSARECEAYQKALQALGSGAERDFRIVEGA